MDVAVTAPGTGSDQQSLVYELSRAGMRLMDDGAVAMGSVSSVEPRRGDPELVAVWQDASAPWVVDRRTMRIVSDSASSAAVARDVVERVADAADRAQLALGRPIEFDWRVEGSRVSFSTPRLPALQPSFTDEPFRRISVVAADEGTVAPLAVDTLDMALRQGDEPEDAPRVRRIYSRAYRREDSFPRPSPSRVSLGKGAIGALRLAADVTAPIASARRFVVLRTPLLTRYDAVALHVLDMSALVHELRARQRTVVDGLRVLERLRLATLAVRSAIEAVLGPLPRPTASALFSPRATRTTRRIEGGLVALGRAVVSEGGVEADAEKLTRALRADLSAFASDCLDTRVFSLDIVPPALGEDLAETVRAATRAQHENHDARERLRAEATDELFRLARRESALIGVGVARESIVATLALVLSRLASAKGHVCDFVAGAQLRLRRAALQSGRQLVAADVLDAPEDVLYLDLAEIEEALAGEPGAYSARVRLRREDDLRWRNFSAPLWVARSL